MLYVIVTCTVVVTRSCCYKQAMLPLLLAAGSHQLQPVVRIMVPPEAHSTHHRHFFKRRPKTGYAPTRYARTVVTTIRRGWRRCCALLVSCCLLVDRGNKQELMVLTPASHSQEAASSSRGRRMRERSSLVISGGRGCARTSVRCVAMAEVVHR